MIFFHFLDVLLLDLHVIFIANNLFDLILLLIKYDMNKIEIKSLPYIKSTIGPIF
jgi:hypothetical protein